ncbi:hydrolase, partial [Streptomyces broussonetiae]
RFYRALLGGQLVGPAALKQMQTTVPATGMDYGLGIYALDIAGCGRFWGHDGAVFGAGTIALSSPDGRRQVAAGWNLMKYERLKSDGTGFEPSAIDDALNHHVVTALCPSATPASARSATASLQRALTGTDLSPTSWVTVLR